MKHHADLLDAAFWQGHKERILAGHVHDVFPYEPAGASPRSAPRRCGGRHRPTEAPTPARCADDPTHRT
jgi:hypothetical protein